MEEGECEKDTISTCTFVKLYCCNYLPNQHEVLMRGKWAPSAPFLLITTIFPYMMGLLQKKKREKKVTVLMINLKKNSSLNKSKGTKTLVSYLHSDLPFLLSMFVFAVSKPCICSSC